MLNLEKTQILRFIGISRTSGKPYSRSFRVMSSGEYCTGIQYLYLHIQGGKPQEERSSLCSGSYSATSGNGTDWTLDTSRNGHAFQVARGRFEVVQS
jgi:hypothetical protein